jgi:hypothetical protein
MRPFAALQKGENTDLDQKMAFLDRHWLKADLYATNFPALALFCEFNKTSNHPNTHRRGAFAVKTKRFAPSYLSIRKWQILLWHKAAENS